MRALLLVLVLLWVAPSAQAVELQGGPFFPSANFQAFPMEAHTLTEDITISMRPGDFSGAFCVLDLQALSGATAMKIRYNIWDVGAEAFIPYEITGEGIPTPLTPGNMTYMRIDPSGVNLDVPSLRGVPGVDPIDADFSIYPTHQWELVFEGGTPTSGTFSFGCQYYNRKNTD